MKKLILTAAMTLICGGYAIAGQMQMPPQAPPGMQEALQSAGQEIGQWQ
jgi:hypothetical protein